ncbi:MAG: hypothetical protein AAB316_15570 [Bacteroidota bacterium]
MRQFLSTLSYVLFSCFCFAQNLPTTNIYLLQIEKQESLYVFRSPRHLTAFNLGGYNNQPAFISNTELLFSAALKGENQTDIYLLDLQKNTRLRMTRTPESEYSPMVTPENLFFSVVRVETDAERSQRLWQYPLDRKDKGKPVFKYLRGIGYYYWLDRARVALFNVADVNYMSIGSTQDESTRHLAPNIGRCFQMSPSGRLVFVHKVTPDKWMVKAMDKATLAIEEIVETVSGSEDFAILKDGTILMGKGSRLYKFHPKQDQKWMEVADLRKVGITSISRLAVSGDNKLAIVNGAE